MTMNRSLGTNAWARTGLRPWPGTVLGHEWKAGRTDINPRSVHALRFNAARARALYISNCYIYEIWSLLHIDGICDYPKALLDCVVGNSFYIYADLLYWHCVGRQCPPFRLIGPEPETRIVRFGAALDEKPPP